MSWRVPTLPPACTGAQQRHTGALCRQQGGLLHTTRATAMSVLTGGSRQVLENMPCAALSTCPVRALRQHHVTAPMVVVC